MASKKSIEYGIFISVIGLGEGTMSPNQYFEEMENYYPQKDGWKVVDRSVTAQTDSRYLSVYHLEKPTSNV